MFSVWYVLGSEQMSVISLKIPGPSAPAPMQFCKVKAETEFGNLWLVFTGVQNLQIRAN